MDKSQKIKLAAGVGILVVAVAAIGWQMGWFESRPGAGSDVAVAPTPPADAPPVDPNAEDPNNPGRTYGEAPTAPPIRKGGGLIAPGYDPNAPENQPKDPPPSDGGGF